MYYPTKPYPVAVTGMDSGWLGEDAEVTVMLYTNKKDIVGNKIWEADIVEKNGKRIIVTYNEGFKQDLEGVKVLGNLFEDISLLLK